MSASSQSTHNSCCDIAIVGAGLVGASLAALLARNPQNKSLRIALVERSDEPSTPDVHLSPPQFDSRVVALTAASVSLLESVGAWSQVLNQRACAYRHMTVWDNEGTGFVEFDAKELNQPALGYIVENNILLSAVLQQLQQFPQVSLIRHHSIVAISDGEKDENHVKKTLILDNGDSIEAKLIIAADGAHSKIRELVELPLREWSYQHKAIVTTVKSEHQHQDTAWQNFLSSGPLAFLPLADASKQFCSIVWSVENERADELMAMSDEEFKQALARAFEYRLGNIENVDKRSCFPLKQRHVKEYFVPQVALIGDAAHTIHPLAGQGVNLGLLDAQALTEEITRASKRKLSMMDESILRRYQRQRKRHNLEIMALMEAFKRLFGSSNIAVRWLRNSGLKTVNHLQPLKNWLARQAMGL